MEGKGKRRDGRGPKEVECTVYSYQRHKETRNDLELR